METTDSCVLGHGVLGTASGKPFDLIHPSPDQVDVEDVAVALARIPHFNGHTNRAGSPPISVAGHCLLVAELLPEELKLQGLVHDAPEAYMGDQTRPWQQALRYALALEGEGAVARWEAFRQRIESAVWAAFGLDGMAPEVKEADALAIHIEAFLLCEWGATWGPPPVEITPDMRRLTHYGGCGVTTRATWICEVTKRMSEN